MEKKTFDLDEIAFDVYGQQIGYVIPADLLDQVSGAGNNGSCGSGCSGPNGSCGTNCAIGY